MGKSCCFIYLLVKIIKNHLKNHENGCTIDTVSKEAVGLPHIWVLSAYWSISECLENELRDIMLNLLDVRWEGTCTLGCALGRIVCPKNLSEAGVVSLINHSINRSHIRFLKYAPGKKPVVCTWSRSALRHQNIHLYISNFPSWHSHRYWASFSNAYKPGYVNITAYRTAVIPNRGYAYP